MFKHLECVKKQPYGVRRKVTFESKKTTMFPKESTYPREMVVTQRLPSHGVRVYDACGEKWGCFVHEGDNSSTLPFKHPLAA